MNKDQSNDIIELASSLRWKVGENYHDRLTEGIYSDAAIITQQVEQREGQKSNYTFDRKLDQILTSKTFGFPVMIFILSVILWITIQGANYPSGMLATLLLDTIYPLLKQGAAAISMPWWLDGFLIDGVYLALGWVIAVMLPPMAIFFPLFTLLEDFGYLPRVAFNMDNMFRKAGAHGKHRL